MIRSARAPSPPARLSAPALGTALLAAVAALPVRAAGDPALLGCWRTQEVHAVFSDGSSANTNSNCVTEFGATEVRSRCPALGAGGGEVVMAYEVTGPGRLRWWPARAAATGASPGGPAASAPAAPMAAASGPAGTVQASTPPAAAAPAEVAYSVDDDFAITTRAPTLAAPADGPHMQQVQVLSRRARGPRPCEPLPPSPLRVIGPPPSALTLAVPPGWRAQLVDPATHAPLKQAIGQDFLVGAFVPRPGSPTLAAAAAAPAGPSGSAPLVPANQPGAHAGRAPDARGGPMVIVLDVARFGASPVRAEEFATLRRELGERLAGASPACEETDRACWLLRGPKGVVGYTEVVRVAGRAALVSAVGPEAGSLPADTLIRAVREFTERLRLDNP